MCLVSQLKNQKNFKITFEWLILEIKLRQKKTIICWEPTKVLSMSFQNNWTNSESCMTGLSMFIDFWYFFAYDWNSIQNHVFYSFRIVCMSGTYQTQYTMFPREEF